MLENKQFLTYKLTPMKTKRSVLATTQHVISEIFWRESIPW